MGYAEQMKVPILLASAVILLCGCSPALYPAIAKGTADAPASVPATIPQGYWQDAARADYLVAFDDASLIIAYGGRVREVSTILEAAAQRVRACRFGRDSLFTWDRQGESLVFRDTALQETHSLHRLLAKPAALAMASFHLPQPVTLSPGRTSQIQRELYLRQQKDQASLHASNRKGGPDSDALPWMRTRSEERSGAFSGQTDFRFVATVTENTEYIMRLLAEVGWIDAERFGYSTSNSAFLLVQHSWDPSLMLAVLPHLKQDIDAGRMDAITYALLFDRLQLTLGKRQRFGSQVATDEEGATFVLPVEDPAKVDSLRKELGLIPLKEYVHVFGASEVKFSQACNSRQPDISSRKSWQGLPGPKGSGNPKS